MTSWKCCRDTPTLCFARHPRDRRFWMYHGQTGYCAGPEVGLWEVGRSIWNLFLAVLTRPIIDKFLAHWCSNRVLFPDVEGSWRSWIIAAAFKFPLSNLKSTTLH